MTPLKEAVEGSLVPDLAVLDRSEDHTSELQSH